jgi:hypothetical protein
LRSEPTVHCVSLLAEILARPFAADELDDVRTGLGQVRDLAHNGHLPAVRERILALRDHGHGPSRIARQTGLSRRQVARVLAANPVEP